MNPISNIKVKCPNCKHEFGLEETVSKDFEKEVNDRFLHKWNEKEAALRSEIYKKEAEIRAKEQTLNDQLQVMLQAERTRLTDELRKKLSAEIEDEVRIKNKELEDNQNKIRELNKQAAEFEIQKRAMQDKQDSMALEMQKQLNEERGKMIEQIQKQTFDAVEMKLLEKDKQIADQNRLIDEMKRKSEQGSMQLQGEVQELALEQLLRDHFKNDLVKEVGKGIEGADCELIVHNKLMQEAGKILFESKRTKLFKNDWIDKLKKDLRSTKAHAAVIVTSTMPKSMDSFGEMDGVWICKFSEVIGVTALLRLALLKVHDVSLAQLNKGDKMSLLYDFMTSEEFKQQMEAIREGFLNMRDSISKEKIFMNKTWAEREKQVDKVLLNISNFGGSIVGIAGNSVPDIKLLGDEE